MFGTDLHEHEAVVYGQTLERGGVVVSARVVDSEVAHATAILDLHHPVDVQDRAVTSGIAPIAHVAAVEKKLDAIPLAPKQTVAVTPKLVEAHDEVLRLAQPGEVALGRDNDASLALDRLDQHGRGVRRDRARDRVEVAERHRLEARGERAEAVAVVGLGAGVDGSEAGFESESASEYGAGSAPLPGLDPGGWSSEGAGAVDPFAGGFQARAAGLDADSDTDSGADWGRRSGAWVTPRDRRALRWRRLRLLRSRRLRRFVARARPFGGIAFLRRLRTRHRRLAAL